MLCMILYETYSRMWALWHKLASEKLKQQKGWDRSPGACGSLKMLMGVRWADMINFLTFFEADMIFIAGILVSKWSTHDEQMSRRDQLPDVCSRWHRGHLEININRSYQLKCQSAHEQMSTLIATMSEEARWALSRLDSLPVWVDKYLIWISTWTAHQG